MADSLNDHLRALGINPGNINDVLYHLGEYLDATFVSKEEQAQRGQLLTAGEETLPRLDATSLVTRTSGLLILSYFTARKTEDITTVGIHSGSTAAGATPTLVRGGVYEIDEDGDGTLLAAYASDTAVFAGQTTRYTKTLTSTFEKEEGQRYAWAELVVTGATAPTGPGAFFQGSASGTNLAPRVTGGIAAQTDLPASFSAASVAGNRGYLYAELLP